MRVISHDSPRLHPGSTVREFRPTPKIAGSERSATFESTYEVVRHVARRIPIARLTDLTPLDDLGLPAFAAITPLARDLKVHNGKGTTAAAARVSALMEAVERVSAETIQAPSIFESYDALRTGSDVMPVDPRELNLPADSEYAPSRPITWVAGWDLLSERAVLIPLDLVQSPPTEGVLRHVDTNGLASGNTHLEAIVHAICEVIERDALSQLMFATSFGDPDDTESFGTLVEPATLPDAARQWADRILDAGFELDVLDITSDVGVPTFKTLLTDDHYPSPTGPQRRSFFGLGTHPNPEVAVFRAVSEAIQSRLVLIQAARDSYNLLTVPGRAAAMRMTLARWKCRRRKDFADIPAQRSRDLLQDLQFVLGRLRSAGLSSCIVVDVTRPDWQIPVVRVRIPTMSEYAVNMQRIGTRCLRHLL